MENRIINNDQFVEEMEEAAWVQILRPPPFCHVLLHERPVPGDDDSPTNCGQASDQWGLSLDVAGTEQRRGLLLLFPPAPQRLGSSDQSRRLPTPNPRAPARDQHPGCPEGSSHACQGPGGAVRGRRSQHALLLGKVLTEGTRGAGR